MLFSSLPFIIFPVKKEQMPLISVKSSLSIDFDQKQFLYELSETLSTLSGKPESYIMTIFERNVQMTFAGSSDPCCYVEVKSIGALKPAAMSKSLCAMIHDRLGVSMDRIYINFQDIEPSMWGFNGRTF